MDNVQSFDCKRVIEDEAAKWIVLLDRDHPPNKKDLEALQAWMDRSPAHREELWKYTEFWDSANILTELNFPLHNRPDQGLKPRKFSRIIGERRHFNRFGVVFSVIVLSTCIAFLMNISLTPPPDVVKSSIAGNGVYETRLGEQNAITLADGSTIQLNTNSRVQVNYTRHQRNIVLNQGEAFFQVSPDSRRPFKVLAGGGLVKAVGTAFAVRLNHRSVEVTVTEGKVTIAAGVLPKSESSANSDEATAAAVDLASLGVGQRVVFDPSSPSNIAEAISTLEDKALEQQLDWRDGMLQFTGESLQEVVREMSRYTNIQIEIADPTISDLSIGGQFDVGDSETMLNVLAGVFDIEVQWVAKDKVQLVSK